MIIIARSEYERLLDHALAELPNEACGLVAGVARGEDKIIRKVYLLTNTEHAPEHFSLDPREQLEAVRDMRAGGMRPLGNWHSHPSSPARMSQEDRRLAHDKGAVYLILSLENSGHPVLRGFVWNNGACVNECVAIVKARL